MLEMGLKTLDNYWKETAALYKHHHYYLVNEFAILKVLRQIAETIQEVHDRGNVRCLCRMREKFGTTIHWQLYCLADISEPDFPELTLSNRLFRTKIFLQSTRQLNYQYILWIWTFSLCSLGNLLVNRLPNY
jgi:hypothetical protein